MIKNRLFITGVRLFLKDGANPIGDILVMLGKGEEVKALREEYDARKHKGPFGLEKMAELYGEFSEKDVLLAAEKYCEENMKAKRKELVEKIKEKGCKIGVVSANPQLVLDFLKERFDLDFVAGTEFYFEKGKLKSKVDRYKKAEILKEKAFEFGVKKENIVVLGSSVTDLPMAENAGKFIVVGAKDDSVKEKASVLFEEFNEEDFLKEL